MLPTEVQHDIFSCLSRNDVETLQITCARFHDNISTWIPKAPLRLLSRITVVGNQLAVESTGSATAYINAERLMVIMRSSYTEELAVGAPEVDLEFAEHAVAFRLTAAHASCTVNGDVFKLRSVDDRATITFDSNLWRIDENGTLVDPGAVRELSIDVTECHVNQMVDMINQLMAAGFQLTV